MKKVILIILALTALQACKKEEKGNVVRCFCCFNDELKSLGGIYSFEEFKTLGEKEIARRMRAFCKERDSSYVYCGYQYNYTK